MNAQNITEVKITMDDGNTKRVSVDENGMILVIGSGPCAGAFRVRLEEATEAELNAAEGEIIEEETFIPFDEKLAKANDELKQSSQYKDFEAAVKFLTELNADEFMELVLFAKDHGNRFPKCSAVRNVINADDAYCSALIGLSRPCGEQIENAAFKLLADCIDAEPYAPVFDTFKRLWKSLKTLRELTGHQVTSLTIE